MEEGKLVFDTYMQRRFSTSTCRNAAGLILAARLIPGILSGSSTETCSAVSQIGTCPFYITARFVKQHDGWADYWRYCFVDNMNDCEKTKAWKAMNRPLLERVNVESVKGDVSKVIEKLIVPFTQKHRLKGQSKNEPAYPAFALFQQLAKHLGLEPKSTHNDVPAEPKVRCPDSIKRVPYRMNLSPYNFGVMLMIKNHL